MEDCKADKGSFAVANAVVGMVIGGRSARACDVCGNERARWYCAADLAYLCERCDGSVHAANAVARRHERVRLGPDGVLAKMARKLSASGEQDDAAAAGRCAVANLSPRKRPRSIRRHKPGGVLQASKRGTNSIQYISNIIHSSSSNLNASLIYAPSHNIMINNPRNDADFIPDSAIEFGNKFVVKAEPVSPTDVREHVKVPDHTDDDPLFESLFDFRDLQEDDHFLHQVPIYNPPRSADNSPSSDRKQPCVDGDDEMKSTFIITPNPESKDLGSSKSPRAATRPSEISQAELDTNSASHSEHVEDNRVLSIGKCEEPNRFTDLGGSLCELDQLDFDSMLHGDDEDDEESDLRAFHVDVNSHGYGGESNSHVTRAGKGSQAEDHSCAQHGNPMDEDDVDDTCDAVEHADYGETFDFDAVGGESPRAWLCKVKVESPPPELDGFMQVNGGHADDWLSEKLTCKASHKHSVFKLGLKLNFEDVLHAWSDRGTFWTDGNPPLQIESCLDFLGGWLVPDMGSIGAMEGDGQQLVPVFNQRSKKGDGGAREASVLRYREKRRTRLFCKKIRYEVRKLNAEKRPRMKGRFVKRISIVV